MQAQVSNANLSVVEGDITTCDVDVIVNAANELLAHGGGVAAAISRAGGPVVQDESDEWVERNGPLGFGSAAVTGGGDLKATSIVHVVGPRYSNSPDDESHLRSAVSAALDAVSGLKARSLAFPAISSGVFGYPVDEATAVIVDEAARWLRAHDSDITRVQFVAFDGATSEAFAAAVGELGD